MPIILLISTIFLVIGVMLVAEGYNLRLPYYDRRKLLSGMSFKDQWRFRYLMGKFTISSGLVIMGTSILLGFGLAGMLTIDRYKDSPIGAIKVVQMEDYTAVITTDETIHKIDMSLAYCIDNKYSGIFWEHWYNLYGMKIHSSVFVYIDILPEEDERFLDIEGDE